MNKALFLDRDGVINVDKGYVHKIEDFEFIDSIFDVLKYFQDQGYLLIIITNQAGIGRGYYTEEDFHRLNDWMLERFRERGIEITKVYYCPYHPEGMGKYKGESKCRKPNPGMILEATSEFNINLKDSILVGDKEGDVQAGQKAGIIRNILIRNTGKTYSIGATHFTIDSIKDLLFLIY